MPAAPGPFAGGLAVADRTPVIAGIALSEVPRAPGLDAASHHALAAARCLEDAGMALDDVDGYACAGGMDDGTDLMSMAEYLGIRHRYVDGTMTGGSSYEVYVQHAAAAIQSGLCDSVLVTYGSDLLSRQGRMLGSRSFHRSGEPVGGPLAFEAPYGNVLIGAYAMVARRHMHEFGTTPEQLAEVAVAVRHHASMNPAAMYRDPISVDDVLGSRMIADPLHLLDCCVISDGGGAVLLTTAERARDLRQPPVTVLAAAGGATHWNISQMPDFTTSAAVAAGRECFARAGLRPQDVDVVQLYDSFTITVLLLLEGLGFCGRGEGGPFVEGGTLRLGGPLPCNTDGGGLSACHPGMRGIFLLVEAVRQLRGQAGSAQVPNCEVALCCGSGGWLSYISPVLLARSHR